MSTSSVHCPEDVPAVMSLQSGTTLIDGRDKRLAYKNRWLKGKQTRDTVSVDVQGQSNGLLSDAAGNNDGTGDNSTGSDVTIAKSASTRRRSSDLSGKNRWLKSLLTTTMLKNVTKNCSMNDQTTVAPDGDNICLMSESPLYVLKLAAQGKLQQLESIISRDKTKLEVADKKGRTLLHCAARGGHVLVMEFLLGFSSVTDIDKKDFDGNTPLHEAVEADNKESIDFLLTHGADPSVWNERKWAPIHTAVALDKQIALQALLQHDSVDPNARGDRGCTPFHIAAYKDRPVCAQILLDTPGAKSCIQNDLGMYPIHVCAYSSASATLEVFFKHAQKKGFNVRDYLLKRQNLEKNTPLHTAVSSGDVKTVKVFIDAGADILSQQENGSTPLHLAAGQNSLEMIKIMFEANPDTKLDCMALTDNLGQTALHRAAALDQCATVEYLVHEGAEMDIRDNDGQTALLLAASKCAWSVVNLLVKLGADKFVHDNANRNIVHLIIRGGGQPSKFGICMCKQSMSHLLNEPDKFGCTPLHYASKLGQLGTIRELLQLGAQLNAKNHKQQSALHFAARYGRYNSCQRLLSSPTGTHIINEPDGIGQTALHVAAEGGHVKVVQLLLQHGAAIFKDMNGNTALHLAAANGYTHTMAAIINIHGHLLDVTNKNFDTCLHIAARSGHPNVATLLLDMGCAIAANFDELYPLDIAIQGGMKDVCVAVISHDRWKEAMDKRSKPYGCPMNGMIKYMPEVCQMILDRCRTPSGADPRDPDYHYTYDFKYLQIDHARRKQLVQLGVKVPPLFAHSVMVAYNRVECLSHPVCTAFLAMKWCVYGVWFHLLNLFVYLAFLCCLTVFISVALPACEKAVTGNETLTNTSTTSTDEECKLSFSMKLLAVVILIFCLINAIKEIMQMVQQRWAYLGDHGNFIEWILYITCSIFIGPFLCGQSNDYQWQCGAVAIFLAWFNLLLFMQRFDVFGIYVVMFLEILRTLVRVIVVFSVLVVAFGYAFLILLYNGESYGFSAPGISLLSTSIMMLGNIDYLDVWVNPFSASDLPNPYLNFIMLLLFVLLMPILLINLLIGLAVGDIESVQKNARLKRIAMQVQLHNDLEQKLPSRLLKYLDRPSVRYYVNKHGATDMMPKSMRWLLKSRVVAMAITGMNEDGGDSDVIGGALDPMDQSMEHHQYLYRELHNHKQRMKKMSTDMQKQYDLLRLIVQKMEIHTEADDVDDFGGCSASQSSCDVMAGNALSGSSSAAIGWSSSSLRHVMLKQAMVISKWKKSEAE